MKLYFEKINSLLGLIEIWFFFERYSLLHELMPGRIIWNCWKRYGWSRTEPWISGYTMALYQYISGIFNLAWAYLAFNCIKGRVADWSPREKRKKSQSKKAKKKVGNYILGLCDICIYHNDYYLFVEYFSLFTYIFFYYRY